VDVFRANFCATLRDVAVTNALGVSQFLDAILGVERMHFERGHVNEKARPDKFVIHLVIAQDMANILAEKTFDALSKFLNAIDILLLHSPRSIRRIGRTRLEFLDLFLHPKIPGNISN
jgi:hypothetical protein